MHTLPCEGRRKLSLSLAFIAIVAAMAIALTDAGTAVAVGTPWLTTGNAGTNPSTNFLGTTDARGLSIRTNNTIRMRVSVTGLVGVGTNTLSGQLTVAGSKAGQTAVVANSPNGNGVSGFGGNGIGVLGDSATRGLVGTLGGISCPGSYAVGGCGGSTSEGVLGTSSSRGVIGTLGTISCPGSYAVGGCGGTSSEGVLGDSSTRGVIGTLGGSPCPGSYAVGGCGATTSEGVLGDSTSRGVIGTLDHTSCAGGYAVGGCAGDQNADGVYGVAGTAGGVGVRAANPSSGSGVNVFVAEAPVGTPVARIDGTGKGFFDGGTQTGGADYAESISAVNAAQVHPGDVLAIDPSHGYAVTRSSRANSQLAVGVYSTRPAVLAVGSRKAGAALSGQVPVAMMGVVPTKVTAAGGAIHAGDLLTSSSVAGYAMKARAVRVHGISIYQQGTIIGKALQPLRSGRGVIQVMLMSR